jgi:hypothetical protein
MMKIKLPDTVASAQDINSLIIELRDYNRWLTHETIKHQVGKGHASPAPEISASTQEVIRNLKQTTPTSHDIDELIKSIDDQKKAAPSLVMTLAAPPSASLKSELVFWCRKNVDPNVLVTFMFNSTLLGGMVVRYGSHIFDWSFRRQILANRSKFPEVLRRV